MLAIPALHLSSKAIRREVNIVLTAVIKPTMTCQLRHSDIDVRKSVSLCYQTHIDASRLSDVERWLFASSNSQLGKVALCVNKFTVSGKVALCVIKPTVTRQGSVTLISGKVALCAIKFTVSGRVAPWVSKPTVTSVEEEEGGGGERKKKKIFFCHQTHSDVGVRKVTASPNS